VILGDALLRRGVPIVPQWELVLSGEATTHPDLAVPEARWGIELDIFPEHRSVEGAHRDARRMRSRHRGDWQVEPVSELDMLDVEGLADELAALYSERVRAIRVLGDHQSDAPHSGAFQHSDDPHSGAFQHSDG
jgi:hypothetical protein